MSPVRATLFIAQGASPGLGIDTHFLSPVGAALTEDKTNLRPLHGLKKNKFYLFFCGALQNAVIARH